MLLSRIYWNIYVFPPNSICSANQFLIQILSCAALWKTNATANNIMRRVTPQCMWMSLYDYTMTMYFTHWLHFYTLTAFLHTDCIFTHWLHFYTLTAFLLYFTIILIYLLYFSCMSLFQASVALMSPILN